GTRRFPCSGRGPAAGVAGAGGAAPEPGGAVPPPRALHGRVRGHLPLYGVRYAAAASGADPLYFVRSILASNRGTL
ncbi:unnamed protein product, partial [Urochloa humidicola]